MTQMVAEVLFDEGKCIISKNERKVTIGHLVDSRLYMVNRCRGSHRQYNIIIVGAMALSICSFELLLY